MPKNRRSRRRRLLRLADELYLSARGHDVIIVDNLSRQKIDLELEVQSLTPIRPVGKRLAAWREVGGSEIRFLSLTVGENNQRLATLIREEEPDATRCATTSPPRTTSCAP